MHQVVPNAAIYRYVCACALFNSVHLEKIFNKYFSYYIYNFLYTKDKINSCFTCNHVKIKKKLRELFCRVFLELCFLITISNILEFIFEIFIMIFY